MNPYENIDWMLNNNKQLHLSNLSGRSELFKKFKTKNIMQEKMFKDLEEMSERNAPFTDYFHKMFEIIDNVEGNQRAILLYKVISDIREIGYKEGKRAEKEALLNFLNNR